MSERGYFGIGIYHTKTVANVGTLWRSASQLGAAFIFTIGQRYPKQASDTLKTDRHVPLFEYTDFDHFNGARPYGAPVYAVEMGGRSLVRYTHQQRCIYLLGAEDNGIPPEILARCSGIISIPSIRTASYNVSVAGSIVMYDRLAKASR